MKLVRRLTALFAFSLLSSCWNVSSSPSWPVPLARRAFGLLLGEAVLEGERASGMVDSDDSIVSDLPVCVASKAWSAGELGHSVLYHAKREGRTLTVGYFFYWTTERPWGKNALSYSVLPALFIDAFYSHSLFLFPGVRQLMYGPGDIEGARVVYEQGDDGRWVPTSAVASNALHKEIALAPEDFVDSEGRVVLMTDVWSHQLGASGARAFAEARKDDVRCFSNDSIAPLTAEVARDFRLGSPTDPRRAPPAWNLATPAVKVAVGDDGSPVSAATVPVP